MERNLKKSFWVILFSLVLTLVSCSEEKGPSPLENNPIGPGMVENVTIENLSGKVKLTYELPDDQDLLYVKANYKLENGTEMEVKSSYYNNSMLLEGFAGGKEVNVKLTAVNRSEKPSAAKDITVSPLLAPIYGVFDSLEASVDFGGIRIKASNPNKENIALLVMTKNNTGDWEALRNSIYTSTDIINKNVRANAGSFESKPTQFAIVVRDRWLNVTDTLFTEITPLFEEKIPVNNYRPLRLDNDPASYPENRVEYLWDNQFGWPRVWVTLRSNPVPKHTVTMDMGTTARISRVHIWDYLEGGNYYYLGSMRKFRIWGSETIPNQSGSFTGWTLLGDYSVVKPSGLPYGQQNNEDFLSAQAGVDYETRSDVNVRYIRIECLESWDGNSYMALSELLIYGKAN